LYFVNIDEKIILYKVTVIVRWDLRTVMVNAILGEPLHGIKVKGEFYGNGFWFVESIKNSILFNKGEIMTDKQINNEEDLGANSVVDTTVEGVDMSADNWLDQAAKKVNAAEGDEYVKLDSGLLTVNQLNYFLKTIPIELTYVDENNQFIYYNRFLPTEKMLAKRRPAQVGDPLSKVHPQIERVQTHVKQVISALRAGDSDLISMAVPGGDPDKNRVMHYYKAMHDEEGNYKGVNEWVVDIKPIVDKYLKETGQKLVNDPDSKIDVTSGASKEPAVDATSGASEEPKTEPEKVVEPEEKFDATSSASKH